MPQCLQLYLNTTFSNPSPKQTCVFTCLQFKPFNSVPNDKILDWSKFKAFADYKIKLAKMIFVFYRVENTVGKRENAGYQHFLLFPQCFQTVSHTGSSKAMVVW